MVVYYKNFALSGAIVFGWISIIGLFCPYYYGYFTKDTFYLTAKSYKDFIALIGINSKKLFNNRFAKQLVLENNLGVNEAIAKAAATKIKTYYINCFSSCFLQAL